ncbi:serine hydrolase [Ilumatobacter sp.]|uniref:serine hydrolase n=1 Tax=Ilumatobacter sp. TaxID=1967498 RepID=UPI003C3AA3AD
MRFGQWATIGTAGVLMCAAVGCSDDGNDSSAADSTAAPAETDGPAPDETTVEDTSADGAPDDDAITGDTSGITAEAVAGSFDTLDGIVERVMADTGVPGVAVGVVYDDELVYAQGYGVRSVDADDPVDANTVFQLASLSKPISSTVMSGLVGQETFEWDDPVIEYAPQFALDDEWVTEHVTFADLFSHRSGLPGGAAGNDLEQIGFDRDTILPLLAFVPIDGFRETYSYSNWAMTLGAEIGGIAAGSDWETVSDDVLFGPAGMDNTSMRHEDFLAEDNRAELHVPRGDGEWVADFPRDPDPQAPAGGVSSNVIDLAEWMRIQLGGGELDGEAIIDGEALSQTHVPHITSRPPVPPNGGQAGLYGLGWGINTEFGGLVTWAHSGAFSNGANTTVKLVPQENLGIVVLSNGAPVGAPETIADAYVDSLVTGEDNTTEWSELWSARMGGVYGEPLDLGPEPSEPDPAEAPDVYAGTYSNGYVGEVTIAANDDGTLEMGIGPIGITYTLEHHDADTFVYAHSPELPDFVETATFEIVDGRAASLTLSAMDGAGLGTLERV